MLFTYFNELHYLLNLLNSLILLLFLLSYLYFLGCSFLKESLFLLCSFIASSFKFTSNLLLVLPSCVSTTNTTPSSPLSSFKLDYPRVPLTTSDPECSSLLIIHISPTVCSNGPSNSLVHLNTVMAKTLFSVNLYISLLTTYTVMLFGCVDSLSLSLLLSLSLNISLRGVTNSCSCVVIRVISGGLLAWSFLLPEHIYVLLVLASPTKNRLKYLIGCLIFIRFFLRICFNIITLISALDAFVTSLMVLVKTL